MQTSNLSKSPFIVVGLTIFAIYAAVVGWAYATGRWILTQDSEFSELGVCLQDNLYAPTLVIPKDSKSLYVCGRVEGTTRLDTVFYLYQVKDEKVLQSQSLSAPPGVFFYELDSSNYLTEGNYRLEFSREKIIRAKFVFTVK